MSFNESARGYRLTSEHGASFMECEVRNNKGDWHGVRIRLDDHIGNTDGWFIWGGQNFSESASDIKIENTDRGPKLTAELRKRDGGHRERQGMFLADKIENRDGHLHFTGP